MFHVHFEQYGEPYYMQFTARTADDAKHLWLEWAADQDEKPTFVRVERVK